VNIYPSKILPRSLLLLALLSPSFAQAHSMNMIIVDWSAGFIHPLQGFDHILAMLAVGFWAAQLRAKAIWVLPFTFVSVMSLGGLIGTSGLTAPNSELIILLSGLVLSIFTVTKVRFNTKINTLIVAFFAFFHGYAHGSEILVSADFLPYSLGFITATLLLHGTGIMAAIFMQFILKPKGYVRS
jgi:urease accessory protein